MSSIQNLRMQMSELFEKQQEYSNAEYLERCNELKAKYELALKSTFNKYIMQINYIEDEYIEIQYYRIKHLE